MIVLISLYYTIGVKIISSSELLRVNSVEISRMITDTLWNVTQELHAKGIIIIV